MEFSKAYWKYESKSLHIFIGEIAKNEVLSFEQEVRLFNMVKLGDKRAFERIIKANLKFVVRVANEYRDYGLPVEDLINEGNIGLMKAVERFDVTKGFKFLSYAVWWIRQSITKAISEHSRAIRLPGNRINNLSRCIKVISDLEAALNRPPTVLEIAESLELSYEDVLDSLEHYNKCSSLDRSSADYNSSYCLLDTISERSVPMPDSQLISESIKVQIRNSLKKLTQREQEVIRLAFGIDMDCALGLQEIGERFSLSKERIRQIKENALKRLRQSSGLAGITG